MARELQNRVIEVVHSVYGGELEVESAPEWMLRPGRVECRRRWPLLQKIYTELTGLELPETMPPREHRRLDVVPDHVVHPGHLEGWRCRSHQLQGGDPDEVAR